MTINLRIHVKLHLEQPDILKQHIGDVINNKQVKSSINIVI
jgi:hypothetical protein